ncbi:MAG: response regulator [Anaerolineae bacterium]
MAIAHNWRIRKLIRANLEALDLNVREAVNGRHGLECLEKGLPDLILLDLDLPDDGALSLLRALDLQLDATPVPVLLLSAEPPARDLLQEGGVKGCLLKPFDVATLVTEVLALLSK